MKGLDLHHSRRAVIVASGLTLALALAGAPAAAQSPTDATETARTSVEVVPLVADLEIVHITVDSQVERETNRVFRDSQGRTRTEAGTLVTINDPTTGTNLILDTAAGTYQQFGQDQPGLAPSAAPRGAPVSHDQPLSSAVRSLGESSIDGVTAAGREYTVTAPAWGELPSREHTVTVWAAPEIQLPVQTRVVEGSGEVYQQTHTNVTAGVEPPASLFEIPAGYLPADRIAQPAPEQVVCTILPSFVILTSFGGVLASGVVPADVIGQGCVFIADQAFFEPPLSGGPLTPLGLPFDDWLAFDTGGPVPFLPWTSFGVIDYAAAAPGGPVSFDSSLIILDIFA